MVQHKSSTIPPCQPSASVFLSRILTLFLLFELSAALKISIQPTVTAGKDTPLNWTRQSSDPQSFKFSLNVALVSELGDNSGLLLKTVDTNGKNQDSININMLVPGRYHILAFLSDSDSWLPGTQQQQDATTDPFDVVPLGVLIPREASITGSDAGGTFSGTSTMFNTSAFGHNLSGTETSTTFPTDTSAISGTETSTPVSGTRSDPILTTGTTIPQTPSKSTSSVPIIIGSLFGAIFTVGVLSLCCFALLRRYRRGLRNPRSSWRYSYASELSHTEHRIDPYTLKPAFVPSPPVTATKRKRALASLPISARPSRKVGTDELARRDPVLPEPTVLATRSQAPARIDDVSPRDSELARRVNDLSRQVERLQSWVIPPAYERH